MRICMVAFTDLNFDFRIYREAASLKKAGHRVSIVAGTWNQQLDSAWDDFDVHTWPVDRGRSLRVSYLLWWRNAYRILREIPADAYHAHDLDSLWPASRAARARRVPLVYDSHELWTEQSSLASRPLVRGVWATMEKRLSRYVSHVITVSPPIADELRERYRFRDVIVIGNLPPHRPPVPGDLIRERLGLESDRVILLYQGGMLTDNGLSEQIEAMAGIEGAALVLLGEGPTKEQLERQVAVSGLADRVFFLPAVPFSQLHALTCSADIGLCLIKSTGKSFHWSLPNKLFEYMMAGLPVLGSEAPEIRRTLTETGAGEVIDLTDPPSLRNRLQRLVADPARRSRYSEAALQAAQRYCWERESAKLTDLYAAL